MQNKKKLILLLSLVFVLVLAACGGGDGGSSGDSVKAGEDLFSQSVIGTQPGCITCHSLEPDTVVVGPSLAGIASRAGSQVSGLSAEEYLRQSILEPDDYVVEGFQPGVMIQVWEDELTEEQIENIISYLMTLQ